MRMQQSSATLPSNRCIQTRRSMRGDHDQIHITIYRMLADLLARMTSLQ